METLAPCRKAFSFPSSPVFSAAALAYARILRFHGYVCFFNLVLLALSLSYCSLRGQRRAMLVKGS